MVRLFCIVVSGAALLVICGYRAMANEPPVVAQTSRFQGLPATSRRSISSSLWHHELPWGTGRMGAVGRGTPSRLTGTQRVEKIHESE